MSPMVRVDLVYELTIFPSLCSPTNPPISEDSSSFGIEIAPVAYETEMTGLTPAYLFLVKPTNPPIPFPQIPELVTFPVA